MRREIQEEQGGSEAVDVADNINTDDENEEEEVRQRVTLSVIL